jgi:hypothetical protein
VDCNVISLAANPPAHKIKAKTAEINSREGYFIINIRTPMEAEENEEQQHH